MPAPNANRGRAKIDLETLPEAAVQVRVAENATTLPACAHLGQVIAELAFLAVRGQVRPPKQLHRRRHMAHVELSACGRGGGWSIRSRSCSCPHAARIRRVRWTANRSRGPRARVASRNHPR